MCEKKLSLFVTLWILLVAVSAYAGGVEVIGDLTLNPGKIIFPDGSKQTTASTDCTGRYELNRNVTYPDGDGTVTDCRTGLIWLKNVICTETSNGIARTDNGGRLSWADAKMWAAGLGDGICGLHDGSYPGDWRLATRTEWMAMFQSARNQNFTSPALTNAAGNEQLIGADVFDNAQPSLFLWSSTEFSPTQAWYFYLDSGTALANVKTVTYDVWPVRAGQ